jgi:hypothetical protein
MGADDFKAILKKVNSLIKFDQAKRRIGFTMLAKTSERIFANGKDDKGSEIGQYSKGYLKTRQRKNWTSSQKVILQATRQMVGDFSLIVDSDVWGLGFKNSDNFEKSLYVENTYNKDIFAHTDEEVQLMTKLFTDEVNRVLNTN